MASYIPFTEEQKNTINEFADSKTGEEIAMMIGKTKQSVYRKASYMGVSLKKIGEDHYKARLSNLQVEMINSLFMGGFKPHEIHKAAFNHVAANTIYSITSCWNRKEK